MEESSGHSSKGEESHHSPSSNQSYDDDDSIHTDYFVSENEEEEEEEEDNDDEGSSDSYDEEEDQDNRDYQCHFENTTIPPPQPRPPKWPKRGTLDDRISALPDSLILHILSFLSMKDVVRTGALSKRWRYLWTSVSTLVFQTTDVREVDTRKFVTFVDKALVLCKCPNIEKFVLYFSYRHCFASDVNVWISFAIQNNVEDLELLLECRHIESYRLPQHMYCNSSLKKLRLNNCLVMPSGVISWKSLKSLSIEGVELENGVIAKILLGSPSLEFLELVSFRFFSPLDITSASLKRLAIKTYWSSGENEPLLEISAPNLQSLEILGNFHRLKFWLRNVSSVINANLNFTVSCVGSESDEYYLSKNLLRELLDSLQHVRELKIGNFCLQVLSLLDVKGGVPFPLSSCKSLTLDTFVNIWDSPGIASLLRSSPNLETLIINMAFHHRPRLTRFKGELINSYYEGENYWTSPKRILKCLLQHLKTVKIVVFRRDQDGFNLSFIQFLLKSATALKRMNISTEEGFSRGRFLKYFPKEMQKMLSFPRSSPDAVIMFS